ncbi:MAG: F0F1 ATP synthase subunit A [Deltaproteobacteria bacterium]|nr:MAG: F0F1 ATP synthase subunit A [Deltaproteobacteria bacterium]
MHDFNWLALLSDKINHHNIHVITSAFIILLLAIAAFKAYGSLKNLSARIIPEGKGTLANYFEAATEGVLGLMEGIMGAEEAPKYFPLIGTVFIYVFLCNAIALVPGFLPPTDNFNTTLGLGLIVFIYYNAMGIKAQGLIGHLKHMWGPIFWLGPLIFVIELIGHCVRPVSLALRLFGNITGDHMVLGIFSDLVPLGVPIIFLALGLFVSFIQAFVFSLLSTIYIGLAVAHEHDDHGHGEHAEHDDHAAHEHH